MSLSSQTIDFISYIFVGIILAIFFDMFRAYRKYKKSNRKIVTIQDIFYFIIATIIIILSNVFILNNGIRFYLFISIIIGITIYITFFSKFVIKLYIEFFKVYHKTIMFIFTPFSLLFSFSTKNYMFFKKIVKNTCKKIKYVIIYIMNKIKGIKIFKFKIQKRVEKNNVKSKKKRKKQKNKK